MERPLCSFCCSSSRSAACNVRKRQLIDNQRQCAAGLNFAELRYQELGSSPSRCTTWCISSNKIKRGQTDGSNNQLKADCRTHLVPQAAWLIEDRHQRLVSGLDQAYARVKITRGADQVYDLVVSPIYEGTKYAGCISQPGLCLQLASW